MRSHGLSSYPDPQVSQSGNQVQIKISPGKLDPNAPAFKSASGACHHLLPNGGSPPSAISAAQQAQDLQFAACMRSHGVPSFLTPITTERSRSLRGSTSRRPSSSAR